MIEVTCAACGSMQRFPDSDGGKVSSCASCKARMTVPRALPSIPSPGSGGGTGDVINLSDLPAPKRPSPLAGAPRPPAIPGRKPPTPAPKPPPSEGLEMPALDMPSLELDSLDSLDSLDLPAPVGATPRGGFEDLPAPVGASPRGGISDLPAPVGASPRGGISDLPAPVGASPRGGISDLPAPRGVRGPGPAVRQGTPDPMADLPAPKPKAPGARPVIEDDLLAPRRPGGGDDLGLDLPAPKPGAGIDLPAPKGFFDELPAPRGPSATKPPSTVDLPAPKGFFDDLPSPRGAAAAPPPTPDASPKGFFDDLPGPRATTPAAHAPTLLSQPTQRPRGMDLDDLDLAPPTMPPQVRAAAPPPTPPTGVPTSAVTAGPMPLDLGGDDNVPPLELDTPSDKFGGLDLPSVAPAGTDPAKAATISTPSPAGVTFKANPSSAPGEAVRMSAPPPGGSLDLDIDTSKRPEPPKATRSAAADLLAPAAPGAAETTKAKPTAKKRRMILLGAIAGVLALGAGGFYFYKSWKAKQDQVELRDKNLAEARRQLQAGGAKHWASAAAAADAVLAISPSHAEALGIAAQAYVAAFLEEGTSEKSRRADAQRVVDLIHRHSARGPQVEKGLALHGVINNDAAAAVESLAALAEGAEDPDVHLYLGWAHAERRQWDHAIEAFGVAANAKNRAVVATYNIGLAQLAKGDLAGAKASFSTVNDLAKGAHLGAQVGIFAALPPQDAARRESELAAILALKEIAKADPRVVAWAHALVGDDQRRAGRLDAAKDSYASALDKQPGMLAATLGVGEIALRERQLGDAEKAINEALAKAPDDPAVNLAAAELLLVQEKLADAATVIGKLKTMTLATDEQKVRLHMLDAQRLERTGDGPGAVEAYAAAQAAAGPGDITAAVAQATLLGRLATTARQEGRGADADAYAARAQKLLGELEDKAKNDPALMLALGRAFLAAGNGDKAEPYFRAAIKARKDDIDAHFNLVEALKLQGKMEEAAAEAKITYVLDPTRVELALQAATTLEEVGRLENAKELFEKLVIDPKVTVNTRIQAGKFYIRQKMFTEAGVQGEAISKAEPTNAAGMYLRGEAAYAAEKWDEARTRFDEATKADATQALYWESLGKANWKTADKLNEPQYYAQALAAYEKAAQLDPARLSAQLGRAHLYLRNQQYERALEAYEIALQLAPSNIEIPYGIGVAYHEAGKLDEALTWLSKAVKVNPTGDTHYRMALIYDKKLDDKKAGEHYAKAAQYAMQMERDGLQAPDWLMFSLYSAGAKLMDAGDERNACRAWRTWVNREPPDDVLLKNVKARILTDC